MITLSDAKLPSLKDKLLVQEAEEKKKIAKELAEAKEAKKAEAEAEAKGRKQQVKRKK